MSAGSTRSCPPLAAPSFSVSKQERDLAARLERSERMLVFVVVAVAMLISLTMVPAVVWAAADDDLTGARPAQDSLIVPTASPLDGLCLGQAWGNETRECLEAIAAANGVRMPASLRIVGPAPIDHTRPNIF